MRIAVLGVGHIGSTVGRLWHAAGHDITFAARDTDEPKALADVHKRLRFLGDTGVWGLLTSAASDLG